PDQHNPAQVERQMRPAGMYKIGGKQPPPLPGRHAGTGITQGKLYGLTAKCQPDTHDENGPQRPRKYYLSSEAVEPMQRPTTCFHTCFRIVVLHHAFVPESLLRAPLKPAQSNNQ